MILARVEFTAVGALAVGIRRVVGTDVPNGFVEELGLSTGLDAASPALPGGLRDSKLAAPDICRSKIFEERSREIGAGSASVSSASVSSAFFKSLVSRCRTPVVR